MVEFCHVTSCCTCALNIQNNQQKKSFRCYDWLSDITETTWLPSWAWNKGSGWMTGGQKRRCIRLTLARGAEWRSDRTTNKLTVNYFLFFLLHSQLSEYFVITLIIINLQFSFLSAFSTGSEQRAAAAPEGLFYLFVSDHVQKSLISHKDKRCTVPVVFHLQSLLYSSLLELSFILFGQCLNR